MSLNTVDEIERAIGGLTPRELEELYAWLEQHCPQPIDAQVKADLEVGRIDERVERALADHMARKRKEHGERTGRKSASPQFTLTHRAFASKFPGEPLSQSVG